MTTKTLSIIAIMTSALTSQVFAKDYTAPLEKRVHALHHYRGAYNQVQGPAFVAPGAYETRQGFDPSRVGGYDPDINPAGS